MKKLELIKKKQEAIKENYIKGKKGKKTMTVFETITAHLEREIGEFAIREDNGAVAFECTSEVMDDSLPCTIHMDEDSFVVVVNLPFSCNMECLDEMAKLIVQINCGMWMGNFDLDYDDGELTFRVFMNAMDVMPSDESIGTAIATAVSAIEMNHEDMYQVACGAQTAHEVIYAGETKIEQ